MNLNHVLILCGLLLTSVNADAQQVSALRSAGNVRLGGAEDPAAMKVYIVQLRSPSAADHHASLVKTFAATSNAAVDDRPPPRFQKNSAVIQSYTARLEDEQQRVLSLAGSGTRMIYSYKYGLNGFAARMSVAEAQKLAGLDEVLNVWEDEIRPLATQYSANFLGLFDGDNGLRSEHALDGDGVIIGIIDSGILRMEERLLRDPQRQAVPGSECLPTDHHWRS